MPLACCSCGRRAADVGLEARAGDLLGLDPTGDLVAELVDALTRLRTHREHRYADQPVGVDQTAYVGHHRLAPVDRHLVDVVEHDEHHVLVGRQRREVAAVDGGVGVLLRVEHPDHQVGELDQAVDLEVVGHLGRVVVGQVEQHHALQRAVLLAEVEQRVAHDLVARGDVEVLQQLGRALLAPHAGGRPRRRRTTYADRGELDARQGVERRRLARAGRAGQGDDGVVGGEPEPGRDPGGRGLGLVDDVVVEAAARGFAGLLETLDAVTQIRAPRHEPFGPFQQGRHLLPLYDPHRRTRYEPSGSGSPPVRCRRTAGRRRCARRCGPGRRTPGRCRG